MSCEQVLRFEKPQLSLRFPKCFSATPADFKAWMLSHPYCLNDDDARDNFNLDTDDLYWYAELTDTGIYNTLKRVSPL